MHSEILRPEGSAAFLGNRDRLWNYATSLETRRDAQLARDVVMALPHELSADERRELARAFVQEQFVSRGMVADLNIHEPQAARGEDPRNHHAHVLLTLRQAKGDSLSRTKTR